MKAAASPSVGALVIVAPLAATGWLNLTLMEGIRNLRTTLGPEGVKEFPLPVEDVT